jgi:hypothetical protein
MRDYLGEVTLRTQPGAGTQITWEASFLPKRAGTGWVLERGIERFLRQCVNGLASYAAASGQTPGSSR